jgi:hypothetical protein
MELNYPFSHLIDIAPMQKICPKGPKTMFAIASMILHRQRENPRRVDCPVEDGRDERGNNYEPPFILRVCTLYAGTPGNGGGPEPPSLPGGRGIAA